MKKITIIIYSILCLGITTESMAQNGRKKIPVDSIPYFQSLIEKFPDSADFHNKYLSAFTTIPDSTLKLYDVWLKRYPNSIVVAKAVATGLYNEESPNAKPYLLEVLKRNPNDAETYSRLSIDAERWGDSNGAKKYMEKASFIDSLNPAYAFYYAMMFEKTDPALWRKKLYELTQKYPNNERGAQGLYWLGYRTPDIHERVEVFETLQRLYPPKKFNWSEGGMSYLFDTYLIQEKPAKALTLAQSLSPDKNWEAKAKLATQLIAIDNLVKKKDYSAAKQLADSVKAIRYSHANELIAILKANILDESGDTKSGYDSLIGIAAKDPTENLRIAINRLGSKLSKNGETVQNDIRLQREKNAFIAPDFNLGQYDTKENLQLKDLKGKVILLTFWFPGCGPCRGEFPHFQTVINKFDKKQVSYIGINVFPEQDKYVLPFMKGTKYSFVPLKGNAEWAKDAYKVRGEPTNFLIDKEGKIQYANFRIDGNNEETLGLMIQSLL